MKGQTNRRILGEQLQRKLRNSPTDAEQLLWPHLRGRQMAGCKYRRQHPFQDYILDFVCLERGLVVELDGGQHAEQRMQDALRDAFLADAGFRVLRFWNHELMKETRAVLEAIHAALNQVPPPPSSLPLEGGREDFPSLHGEGEGFPPLQGEGQGGDGVNNSPKA